MGRKGSRKGEKKGRVWKEEEREGRREELWGLLPNSVKSGPEISGVQFVLSLGMGIWWARSSFLTRKQEFS